MSEEKEPTSNNLDNTPEEILQNNTDRNFDINSGRINFSQAQYEDRTRVTNSKPFEEQEVKDKESDRSLREDIAQKISVMMFCELIFAAVILGGIFLIPFVNAVGPELNFNLPPIVFTITSIIAAMLISNITHKYNNIGTALLKIGLIIGIVYVINFFPRVHWQFPIQNIVPDAKIIDSILVVTETIFIKTTVLAGIIISGLFNDRNKNKK